MSEDTMYSIQFQQELIKVLSTNYQFFTNYGSLINVSYFETNQLQTICRLVKDYISLYEREIDYDQLMTQIVDHCDKHDLSADMRKSLLNEVKVIFHHVIKSEQFIIDKATNFIKRQELKKALIESVDILKNNGDYNSILGKIDRAVSVGDTVDVGKSFEDLLHLPDIYRTKYDPKNMVRTGFPSFDLALDGGMTPGTVHVIMAPPKTGKSTFLCNIGAYNLMHNVAVFHYTLEISEEDVLTKYACRMSNISYKDIRDISIEDFQRKLERYNKLKPNLFVKFYPERTASVMNIRAHISKIRAKTGISPGLIIADYDDCLIPSTGFSRDMYQDSGTIYADLIGLANTFNVPVLTAAQPNRTGWNFYEDEGKPIPSSLLANSALKAMRCSSISSLNFKHGKDDGILYIDINRRGVSDKYIPITRYLDKSAFIEKVEYSKD